ncbi:MAG: RES family NAD+ phosphorylase, partial [Akkermansiaceae bacterium]
MKKWAATAFSDEGVRLYGGRWNSPDRSMVYLSTSRALAALELLVHL